MAKNENLNADQKLDNVEIAASADATELVPVEERANAKAPATDSKKDAANSKKKNVKKEKEGLGRKLKEIFSELKKVSWPTFAQVLKQTGVVLVVVLCFLIVIGAFDAGLSALFKLLVG